MKMESRKLTGKDAFWNGIIVLIVICLAVTIAVCRYRPENSMEYRNADATWHVLLTMTAYDNIPVKEHLFLPIVSINEQDLYNWGAAIPGRCGLRYYASFMPAGFAAPWAFAKMLHLQASENTLYAFNSVLYVLSAIVFAFLILYIFRKDERKRLICLIGTAVYLTMPEILHGMGMVYWHQSLMQVLLPLQILVYLKYKDTGNKTYQALFYALSFINPCVEWTGYVANAGFMIDEIVSGFRKQKSKCVLKSFAIGLLSVCSAVTCVLHFSERIDVYTLFAIMKYRFTARTGKGMVSAADLLKSYADSHGTIGTTILFLFVLSVLSMIIAKQDIRKLHLREAFLFAFPCLENFIMKEHAYVYSYDRMKACVFVAFVLCASLSVIGNNMAAKNEKQKAFAVISTVCAMLCIGNFNGYMQNTEYAKKCEYLDQNKQIAEYINTTYPNAEIGVEDGIVRGYMNVLFQKGITEKASKEKLLDAANGSSEVVLLQYGNSPDNALFQIEEAEVYDRAGKIIERIGEN